MFVNGIKQELLEVKISFCFHFNFDIWILNKNEVVQEFSCESETSCSFKGLVNEVTVWFVNYVVVTDHLSSSLLLRNDALSFSYTVRKQGETDSNESILNEIHFCNFLIFVINNSIIFACLKASR